MHKTLRSLSASMALFQYYKTASPLDSLHHAVCVCVYVSKACLSSGNSGASVREVCADGGRGSRTRAGPQ